jgi:hypothetical protein
VGYGLYKHFEAEDKVESTEGLDFERELFGYMAAAKLSANELLFVDEDNVPLGVPVDFSKAIPEDLRPNGIAISPPPFYWRRQAAERLEADPKNKGRKVARTHSVALDFKAALSYKTEPELVAGIISGKIKTKLDIVSYFAQKPVRGVGKEISRRDYVRESFNLGKGVPSVVREAIEEELRTVIPGLCAKESMFNNSLKSRTGATGIFQFMPNIWKGYGREEGDISSLKIQTETAGLLMSDIYRELMHHVDDHALLRVRDTFASKEDFLRHFITPLIINSYNAGSSRLATAVNQYFTPKRNLDGLEGKDAYLAMADYAESEEEGTLANYKTDAREYVSRAYALSRVL